MSRVQLALNVADLEESIAFYTKLFGVRPAKVRDGYANFAIADPPLKLVLFADAGEPGSLNHLGVEVESSDEVMAAAARARGEDLPTELEESTTCCYAVQDKVWVQGPDNAWEVYTVLADAPAAGTRRESCATSPVADADHARLLRVTVDVTPGRAAWRGADLSSRRDWVYELSADEIEELRAVVERVRAAGLALDELRREDVPLPLLSPVIDGWADELDAGRGFVLVRGVPVDELGEDGCGDRLRGARRAPRRAGVAERCRRSARARPRRRLGPGRSDRASLPDAAGAAVPRGRVRRRRVALSAAGQVGRPVADRQLGHGRRGGGPTSPRPGRAAAGAVVLRSLRRGTARRAAVVRDADRVGAAGPVPLRVSALVHRQGADPLRRTAADGRQVELLDLIDALAQDPELHLDMDFVPGDIQWLANRTILHSRTAYEDDDDPARRRHLLRLWLTLHRNVVDGAGTGGIPVKTGVGLARRRSRRGRRAASRRGGGSRRGWVGRRRRLGRRGRRAPSPRSACRGRAGRRRRSPW